MEFALITLALATSTALGYFTGKNKKPNFNKITIDAHTFEYLKERDEELWQIEKAERARRFENQNVFYIKRNQAQ